MMNSSSLYEIYCADSRVGGDLVLHALELRDWGQDGEVRDGEVGGGHVRARRQEQVQVVQRLLQRVRLPLVSLLAGHQLRVLQRTIRC